MQMHSSLNECKKIGISNTGNITCQHGKNRISSYIFIFLVIIHQNEYSYLRSQPNFHRAKKPRPKSIIPATRPALSPATSVLSQIVNGSGH